MLLPKRIIAGAFATFLSSAASAAIIYDFSPDALGAEILQADSGPTTNISSGVNWIEQPNPFGIPLTAPVRITGMDLYTRVDYVGIGTEVLIKYITLGASGPQLTTFEAAISIIDHEGITTSPNNGDSNPDNDHVRAFADFGTNSFDLIDGPFIIGMSGLNSDIGALLLDYYSGINDDGRDGYLDGYDANGDPITHPADADLAFRLHGAPLTVPDTGSSFALLSLALLGLAISQRKRKS